MAARLRFLCLNNWPLARVLVLLLAGTFVGLMSDLRVEHVDIVRQRSVAWVPIVYSGMMATACLLACIFWNATIRAILLVLFLLAFGVGGLGFYFHNHGHLAGVIKTSMNAWIDPAMNHSDGPPQSAPLAFAGLGMIGALATLKRFNP